jgi:DNA-binding NarL/FixJ family response regulator
MISSSDGAAAAPARRQTIVLVDDHPTLLRGVQALLTEDGRYEVVGTGATAEAVVELAERLKPDILIVDLSMPGDVFAAIETATRSDSSRLLVFTAYGDVDLAMKALDAGAQGLVLKGSPSEDLGEAIEAVLKGDLFVPADFSKKLMAGFRRRSQREREFSAAKLSARERQLVECLLEAKSNKEIARTLNLTEKTVKHYMTNLMNKLRVRSRVEVVLAVQKGLSNRDRGGLTPSDED